MAASALPEYTATEARKHIGETATVVGKIDCIEHGRRHTDLEMGACLPNTLLMVVVPDDLAGLKLDPGQLRGATIAVTGKIESSGGMPQITIKSTKQIVPRTPVGPDYLSTAMEKQSRGDLDGAIADLDRAIEQAHEPGMYVQRAEAKMMKGDLDGAIHDYDQLLEHYPNEGVYYLNRGRLKMKKSDYAGVVADSSRAIELLARHYASHPNDHSTFILAQAYSERGEAKEAMGDPAGAITDYENSVRNDPNAPIYKNKLKHAQAQASRNHEQSFNKSEVTPGSIAEAFVQAYSGADVDALAGLYADRVDHTNSGVITNAAVRAEAEKYFTRWPVRQWSLVGPVKTVSLGATKQKVIFSASYDASDPQTNKHASGIATETLILASDASGAMKIVSQKEQTSKRGSGQPGGETSADLGLNTAKAEYEHSSPDEAEFAGKYIVGGNGNQLQSGYAQSHTANGDEILEGKVFLPTSRSSEGVPWAAALSSDGKLLWAARAQEPPDPSSWSALTTDGDHLWSVCAVSKRVFQLARFNARTLQREASVQTEFPPTFQLHLETDGDLQLSVHEIFSDSLKLAVFSRDLRLVLDKTYSIPDRLAGRESEPLSDMHLIRLPDRTGYYVVVEPHVARGGKRGPRIGIIRLDNSGAIKWANTYTTGYSDSDITPRLAEDGAILVSVPPNIDSEPERSVLMKINPDGTVNWATTVESIYISFDDFQGDALFKSRPYRFTEPSLLAVGTQPDPDDPNQSSSVLFRIDYQTGKIEKQLRFSESIRGGIELVERDAKSFYVAFNHRVSPEKLIGHHTEKPVNYVYHAALLRFGHDFNLLGALKIRDASFMSPFVHLLGSDKAVISYPYLDKKTVMVEMTNANLDSSNACRWINKERFAFTTSNFQQHPAHVDSSPLTVTVSDGNSKISQADLALAPLDLKAVPCRAERK